MRRTGCRCGHSWTSHQHYTSSRTCSACGCVRYRRPLWWRLLAAASRSPRPIDRYDPDVAAVLAWHRATAIRADWQPPLPRLPLRDRITTRITEVLICPACLLPWVVPGHKFRGCR